jgi:hypothetical protein
MPDKIDWLNFVSLILILAAIILLPLYAPYLR